MWVGPVEDQDALDPVPVDQPRELEEAQRVYVETDLELGDVVYLHSLVM